MTKYRNQRKNLIEKDFEEIYLKKKKTNATTPKKIKPILLI